MKYKLLALDMDGTTLNSEKKISPATANAISELLKRGVEVVVATGRGLAELNDYKEDLKTMRYGILISGGMVYDFQNKKSLSAHPVPENLIFEVIDAGLAENAMVHMLTTDKSVARYDDVENVEKFHMGIYKDMYRRNSTYCEDFKKYVRENPGEVLKVNLYHRSLESRARNVERLKKTGLTLVFAEKTNIEASPPNITKASGLVELCKILGIDISETVAVGDAENDLEILQTAGVGVAMGNAAEEIKKVADFVTDDNDRDGVIKVIEKYF